MEDGVWRTIGGRRVFIKKGQSLSDAMKSSGKFKSSKKKSDDKKLDEETRKKMQEVAKQYEEDKKNGKVAERLAENELNERKLRREAIDPYEEPEFLKNATKEEKENYYKNLAEKEKQDKMGTKDYLMEKQREKGNYKDEKHSELQAKANKVAEGLKDKEKSANDIMNERIRSKGKAEFKEDLPKHTEIKTQGTSNRKEVSDNIQAHILDYYTSDFTGEDIPATEAFVSQMDYMRAPNMWKAGEELASGGSYLIYTEDMRNFLNDLKINPNGKEFSDDKVFDTYKSLVGRESAKLYDRIKKNSYNKYMKDHPLSKMTFSEFKDMKEK